MNTADVVAIVAVVASVLIFLGTGIMSLIVYVSLKRVDTIYEEVKALMRTASANVANIGSLTAAVNHLRELMETHILQGGSE